ncbi:hypothetical protein WR25_10000 [Diploscapter pachys]|uniref:Uncharacterized protein n=1 Tax=Diploscapter pachys TaxID=2018661 RepID=A0A2A2KC27_9BILA|nr:hypothetical protein WR25_10000 [Diploscapter pachys]
MLAQRLSLQVFGIAADLAHRAAAIQRIAVGAFDPQRDLGVADVVHRELVVEQAHERAERAGRVIVLRLAQQQRRSPFEIAQVDVVAQCRAHRLALGIDQQHDFGLRVVPRRIGPHADVRAPADRRQHGRFGEDFRIRADRDLQILRPQALVYQRLLQCRGFGRSRHHRAHAAADPPLESAAHLGRRARIATGALFDHALHRRYRKGHARRLHALQVDGGEQADRAVDRQADSIERTDRLARRGIEGGGGD